jgi:hypothetical protein
LALICAAPFLFWDCGEKAVISTIVRVIPNNLSRVGPQSGAARPQGLASFGGIK